MGQMQKIAFVRALVAEPTILLLDEATSNLDDSSKEKIFKILKNRKITIINSTHDPDKFQNVDFNLNIEINNEISEATGITERLVLYSTREYKKTRVRYFVPDDDEYIDVEKPDAVITA